jgi:hypothetical protein
MKYVPYTTKIEEKQLEYLRDLSEKTHIPQAVYIRKAIDLIVEQAKNDLMSPELDEKMQGLVKRDEKLLRRLAKQ